MTVYKKMAAIYDRLTTWSMQSLAPPEKPSDVLRGSYARLMALKPDDIVSSEWEANTVVPYLREYAFFVVFFSNNNQMPFVRVEFSTLRASHNDSYEYSKVKCMYHHSHFISCACHMLSSHGLMYPQ
jgi:hypothetical protein